jgi:hypothetical protein
LCPSPKQGIELLQFTALAFVSHPHPFVGVPHPGPVKQIEDARAVLAIGLVERLDRCARVSEQRVIVGSVCSGASGNRQAKNRLGSRLPR